MEVGSVEWRDLIRSGAEDLGVAVDDFQMDRICRYAEILLEWNRKVNLTAITAPEDVAIKHFIDSMAALSYIPENGTVLDIGSGGGFPGLVIAICRPSLKITSVDSVRKKISFQQHVIRLLGLDNACAVHARVESMAGPGDRSFDVVVSRALGSLELIVTYALPILADTGTIVAYKGVAGEKERMELARLVDGGEINLSVTQHQYRLPKSGGRRDLILMNRS